MADAETTVAGELKDREERDYLKSKQGFTDMGGGGVLGGFGLCRHVIDRS